MSDVAIYSTGFFLGFVGAGAIVAGVVWYRFHTHGRLWGFDG